MDASEIAGKMGGLEFAGAREASDWAALSAAVRWAKRELEAAPAPVSDPMVPSGPLDGLEGEARDAVRAVAVAFRDAKVNATGFQVPLSRAVEEISSGSAEKLSAQRCRAAAAMSGQDYRGLLTAARRELDGGTGERPDAGRGGSLEPEAPRAGERGKKAPAPKDPSAPATPAQESLIGDLARAGVITQEEIDALGASPTKGRASELISSHEGDPRMAEVLAERRERRAAERAAGKAARVEPARDPAQGREGARDRDSQREPRVMLRFPNALVHHYSTKPNAEGKVFDKAICAIPDGVKVHGVDLTGYRIDAFLDARQMRQLTLGRPVVIRAKPDEPLEAFKGKGEERSELQVMPWDLTRALKAERDEHEAASREDGRGREAAFEATKAPRPDGREGRGPVPKDPSAPATLAQESLIGDLARAGVVTQEEIDALGASPTKGQASELISSHEGDPQMAQVIAERRERRAAARAAESGARDERDLDGTLAPETPREGGTEKRRPVPKDPSAPETPAQASLISDLARAGVVTQEELADLGEAPTKGRASALISSHEGDPRMAQVLAERRERRAAARAAESAGREPSRGQEPARGERDGAASADEHEGGDGRPSLDDIVTEKTAEAERGGDTDPARPHDTMLGDS